MEEPEVPTEKLQETILEQAEKRERLAMRVALSSAVIAVFAAVAALLSGHHANEAVIDQLKAADEWAQYQAKSIKATVLGATGDILRGEGRAPPAGHEARIEEYKRQQQELEERARAEERASASHLDHHKILSRAVTLFQIGIAMSAIAVLTRKRRLWVISLVLGAAGAACFVQGLL